MARRKLVSAILAAAGFSGCLAGSDYAKETVTISTCPTSRFSLNSAAGWASNDQCRISDEVGPTSSCMISIVPATQTAEAILTANFTKDEALGISTPIIIPHEASQTYEITNESIHTPTATIPEQPSTPFVPFSQWREKQERVLATLAQTIDEPAFDEARHHESENTDAEVDGKADSNDNANPKEGSVQSQSLSTPSQFIHPQPYADSGSPDDPLLPLQSRTNHASLDCSAAILKSSKLTKSATSILHSGKDRYMLTPCNAQDKFVIVELCEEIDVDTIVLANWEFFSSMFKTFRIAGSQVYPGNKKSDWHQLGIFRAGNLRAAQVFRPPSAQRFFKYLRIDFLSHYGTEHFCPVSMLRVYGRNQMDAFREEEAARLALQLREEKAARAVSSAVSVTVDLVPHSSISLPVTVENAEPSATSTMALPVTTNIAGSSQASEPLPLSSPNATSLTRLSLEDAPPASETLVISAGEKTSETTSITRDNRAMKPTQPAREHSPSGDQPSNFTATVTSTYRPQNAYYAPVPSSSNTGESIYGAITKRLANLEREMSLTLRYIEDQGKVFQDIFGRLEVRLVAAENNQQKQEQALRRLALEFDMQRAKMQEDRFAIAGQINMLAEEILFGKRLGIGQLLALLVIIVLFATTRGSENVVLQHLQKLPRRWPSQRSRKDSGQQQQHHKQPSWPSYAFDAPRSGQRSPEYGRKDRGLLPLRVASIKRQNVKRPPRSAFNGSPYDRKHASAPPRVHLQARSQTPPPRTTTTEILAREPLTAIDLNSLPALPVSPNPAANQADQ